MQRAEIYTKDYCPFCHRAKALLSIKGVDFKEYDITNDTELEMQMRRRTGAHTVPQIYIAGQYIGGCDQLFALDEQGQLDPLLQKDQ